MNHHGVHRRSVDNVGTVLEDLVVHVTLTTGETSPVGQDHDGQLLAIVEVTESLSSLEGRVGVPHTTGFLADLLHGVRVGRVGRGNVLNGTSLDSNDTHRDATEAGTANDNGASPSTKSLLKGSSIEQAREEAFLIFLASDEPADIVRLLRGRVVGDIAVPVIGPGPDGNGCTLLVGHEGHPLDNLLDTLKVIGGSHVRDTVLVHDLSTTELQVRRVNLATQQLVDGRGTSQNDRLAFHLDGSLAQTDKVGTDTNGAAGDQSDGKDILVSARGGSSDETRALQTFNTQAILGTNDSGDLVALFALVVNELGYDFLLLAGIELLLDLGSQVKVLESSLGLLRIVPGHREVGDQLIGHTDASTGVGREVDTRNAKLPGQLGTLAEELVFLGTEGTDLEGDVVGNDDEPSAFGILRGASSNDPSNHTVGVGTRASREFDQVVGIIENKLAVLNALANRGPLAGQGGDLGHSLGPAVLEGLTEQLGEIVDVLGAHEMSLVTLGLKPLLGRVGCGDRTQVHGAELVGTTDAVEEPFTLLRLLLNVQLNLDDEAVGVGDDHTQRIRHASGRIGAQNTDLGTGDTKAPETATEALKETSQGLFHILGLQVEHRREVDEDVVEIGVVVADDLQSIQDVIHETVSLRDQVLRGGNIVTETARSHHGTDEVTLVDGLVVLGALADGLVDVNVPVLGEDRLDLELGQTSEFKLEGEGRFAVTDAFIFLVGRSTEGEVARVAAVLAADEGDAADAASEQLLLEAGKNAVDLSNDLVVVKIFEVADGHVADTGQFIIGLNARSRSTLALQICNEPILTGLLLRAGTRECLQGLRQLLLGVLQVLNRDNHTLSEGLIAAVVDEVGHITNGVESPEGAGLRSWCAGGRHLVGVDGTELRLSQLAKGKVPGDQGNFAVRMILDTFQRIGPVGAANVDLESSQGDPWVRVNEEPGQHIKDSVLGVHHLLEDGEFGLPVVPTGLSVSGFDNGGAQDEFHLRHTLLQRGKRTLDEDLTGLESDLGGGPRLKFSELLQDGLEVLPNIANTRLVGAVHGQDGQDQVVLRANAAVRQNNLNDAGNVVLVLFSELQNGIFVTDVAAREEALDLVVLLQQSSEDIELVGLQAIHILVDDLLKRQEGGLEDVGVGWVDILLNEAGDSLLQLLGGELGLSGVRPIDNALKLSVQLLGHAGMKGRRLSVPFTVGELRVPQNLNQLLQSGVHDHLVVVTHENVLENAVKQGESLRRLATDHLRGSKVGQLSGEWLRMRDTRRVIQSEDTEDVTGFEGGTRLLDELDNTVFLRNQGHVHLHDLDFGEGLTSLDVLAILDSELDKLSGGRRAELSRIILLLQQARLSVDAQASCSGFLLPVDVVTATVQENEQATISQSTDTDRALGSVDEEVVAVQAGSGRGKFVTLALVDEVHGKDGLEDILGRHLTLFEALAVLLDTAFAGQVSLGYRTAQNSHDGVWTLSGQLVRDELIQPSSGDGVLFERRSLQQLDQVLDCRAEVTTDAQLLQSDNHVFPRRRTVLTIGENVTELTVGEAVDTTGGTDGEVTPDVGRTAEVQFVHGTAGGLETFTGIFGSDTAGRRVSLGLRAALGLEALFAGEVEVNLG
ncbi:hypothetical protein IFM46972_02469 [Aspergillus udagawae]|uniref:Uncharacterized protein n=1 Tax=Aspergillus udagawae TaxID=91492 RepID=A0A8H3NA41_9EURO|nr:hypothetical protein IFM46972_02469 [Aspergillus udagawae]